MFKRVFEVLIIRLPEYLTVTRHSEQRIEEANAYKILSIFTAGLSPLQSLTKMSSSIKRP